MDVSARQLNLHLMSRYLPLPLVIVGIACIIGGFFVPHVLRSYSQGYARMAVTIAREPERLENPKAQDAAINKALESSNRLGDMIANASIAFGAVSGAALIFAAHLLKRSADLITRLNDAKTQLEAEIESRYEIKEQDDKSPQPSDMNPTISTPTALPLPGDKARRTV